MDARSQSGDSKDIADGDIGPRWTPPWCFPLAGRQGLLSEKEINMHVAMAVSFAMILVAPFFGRWRANVWLKANMPAEQAAATWPETA
jgi:hypothetical protein